MFHLYKYRLKSFLKNREMIIWSMIFPFLLGTFFYAAFHSITEKSEKMDPVKLAVVCDEKGQFAEFIDSMKELQFLDPVFVKDEKEGKKLLGDEEVTGLVICGGSEMKPELDLKVRENGIESTILTSIFDTYLRNYQVITDVAKKNPLLITKTVEELYKDEEFTKNEPLGAKNADPFVTYMFALLSMTCMFSANFGHENTKQIQADQSGVGMRRSISPTSKMAAVFTDLMAALTVEMVIFAALYFYLGKVLGVVMSEEYGKVFLSGFLANLLGTSLGYFIGVILKLPAKTKEAIISAVVLFMNFMSGLMIQNIKYIIEKKAPVINRINPAALITDSFESLGAIDDPHKYVVCTIGVAVWAAVLMILSIIILRRERYDHV